MPQFILDTSGRVDLSDRRVEPNPAEFTAWGHLDSFTQGYIEAHHPHLRPATPLRS